MYVYAQHLWLVLRYAILNVEVIQAAISLAKQEGLLVSLDLASFEGGYAEVYKGCLPNHQLVAVKRLTRGTADETIGDFLSELGIMAHVSHTNTAKLVGYGVEGGMHLVLELSENGSLASVLYGNAGLIV
ncbi:hypothetical protein AHAS_Ahas02G0236600 [Arachis hypogaea]